MANCSSSETPPTSHATTAAPAVRIGRGLVVVVVGFVASRAAIYGLLADAISDVPLYFDYAVAGVDRGLVPYREIPKLEYPPLAYWTVCLPRYASSWRLTSPDPVRLVNDPTYATAYAAEVRRHLNHYDWGFRGLMAACDAATFVLLGLILARRRRDFLTLGLGTYVVVTSLLCVLLFDRFDIGLTALLLAWAYAWLRSAETRDRPAVWSILAYAALGAGISFKLIPVLAAPFAWLSDLSERNRDRRLRRLILGPATLLLFGAGPFVYCYAQAGDDLGRLFAYHSDRGVQIESTYATLMMVLNAPSKLRCYQAYGAWNLAGPGETFFAKLSPWITLGVLGLIGLRCLAASRFGERYDRVAAYRAACVVIPVAAATSKVLSPQYFLWILPLLIAAAAEFADRRTFLSACAAMVVVAALTTFIFPLHYIDTLTISPPYDPNGPPPFALIRNAAPGPVGGPQGVGQLSNSLVPILALSLRNVLFAALAFTGVYEVLRRRNSAGGSSGTVPRRATPNG